MYDAQFGVFVVVVIVLEVVVIVAPVVLAKVEVVEVGLESVVEPLVLDVLVVDGSRFVGLGVGRSEVGLPKQLPLWQHIPQ